MKKNTAAVLGAAFLCVVVTAPAGYADTMVGGTVAGTAGYYDYSPNDEVLSSTVENIQWCGDSATHTTDTIMETQYNPSTGALVKGETPAISEGPAGAWDSKYVCNPSNVVAGNFVNPLGDGVTYSYAIYYVATMGSGPGNEIGVAFSNDAWTWHKYSSPVLVFTNTGYGYYGYAQPSVQDVNGVVTLSYEDDEATTVHRQATSADGTHFVNTAQIVDPPTGPATWGNIAYSNVDGKWYALFEDGPHASTTIGGVGERGDSGSTLFATSDLVAGPWVQLATFDTNLTGNENNFLGGFVRNPDGTLDNFNGSSALKIVLSMSDPVPAYNASGATLGNSATMNNWQIHSLTYSPVNPWRDFKRLTSTAGHEVTTGWYDSSVYRYESTLGELAEAPVGQATLPLYACKQGSTDYFVSHQSACEGQYVLGLEGYAYSTAAPDRLALYRCLTAVGHFVSTHSDCEGQTVEGLLGYSQI